MLKFIIEELKQSTLFYSLLIWLFLWFMSVILDKYRNHIVVDDTHVGMDYFRSKMTKEDVMKDLKQKLDWFTDPVPKYFYLDSNIIELMYSIREFQLYSKVIYRNIVESIDQFLKISYYCEQYPHSFHILMANLIDLKKEILNQLQAMIFNLPENNVSNYKLSQALNSMHLLLNFHLEYLRNKNNIRYAQTGPNTQNKYINKMKEDRYDLSLSRTLNAELY